MSTEGYSFVSYDDVYSKGAIIGLSTAAGASTGAIVGSIVPVVGTIKGAVGGAALGCLAGFIIAYQSTQCIFRTWYNKQTEEGKKVFNQKFELITDKYKIDCPICPITLEVINKPAYLNSPSAKDRVFEMDALLEWIDSKGICPIDRTTSVSRKDIRLSMRGTSKCIRAFDEVLKNPDAAGELDPNQQLAIKYLREDYNHQAKEIFTLSIDKIKSKVQNNEFSIAKATEDVKALLFDMEH